MRYSASTSSAFALALLAGCASPGPMAQAKIAQHEQLEKDLVGRWTGDPLDPPATVWWAKAQFDMSFSDCGDFSAIVRTFAKKPHELRFEGDWKLVYFLGRSNLEIDERNLGGEWRVERTAPGEIRMSREDMTLALRKRYGS